jgi:hypothetical protein
MLEVSHETFRQTLAQHLDGSLHLRVHDLVVFFVLNVSLDVHPG